MQDGRVKSHTSFLHIVGVIAMATLVLSSWFAHKSLLFKLEARRGSAYLTNRRDTHRPGMRKYTNAVSVYVCMQYVEEACPVGLYHSGFSCGNHQPNIYFEKKENLWLMNSARKP